MALTYPALRDEVNAVDFLALECIRLFAPDVHIHVRENVGLYSGKTKDDELGDLADAEKRGAEYGKVLGTVSESYRQAVHTALELVYPKVAVVRNRLNYGDSSLEEWALAKRACSPDVFPVYFSFAPPRGYFGEADYRVLLSKTGNASAFESALRLLAEERHWSGRGRSRLSAALDMLAYHQDKGFEPLDAFEALLGLANAADAMSIPADALHMGLYTNTRRTWRLASVVLQRHDDPSHLLTDLINRSTILSGVLDWLLACDVLAAGLSKGDVPSNEQVIAGEDVERLRPVALERLHRAANRGVLQNELDFQGVLSAWHRWEPEGARNYAGSLIGSDDGLIAFLLTALHRRRPKRRLPERAHKWEMQRIMDFFRVFVDLTSLQQRAREVLGRHGELSPEAQEALRIVARWNGEIGADEELPPTQSEDEGKRATTE